MAWVFNGVLFNGSSYRISWVRSRLHPGEKVLNIGVGDQLNGFENISDIVLFDMDRYAYKNFVQGDAHSLPFKDGSFDTVLIADVLEHVVDPIKVCREATRVGRRLVLSIFEEWRLGSEGRNIKFGHEVAGSPSVPANIIESIPEEVISHRPHIWQYTDEMIKNLIISTRWDVVEFSKEPECIHQGHMWWNWFVILQKPTTDSAPSLPGDPVNHFPAEYLEAVLQMRRK